MRNKANSAGRWSDAEAAPVLQSRSSDPLRQIWLGRWNSLPALQKAGVVACLSIWVVLILVFLVMPLISVSDSTELFKGLASIGAVTLLLLSFFAFVVTRVR